MNVLMISPGFPVEMPLFTRGLAEVGARVIGLGDQPAEALPPPARSSLAEYVRVGSLADETEVTGRARWVADRVGIDRVECLWEPFMILAARLREALGVPGMTVAETVPFRDKEVMKRLLDEAGIRTPQHASATTVAGVRAAVEAIGYPLILKPIAGAGAAHTYRVEGEEELRRTLEALRPIPEVSVEEFIEGEDYTFDALCIEGRIQHSNMCFYRPRALIARQNEWISPQTVAFREVDSPAVAAGRRMGIEVLRTLRFRTGYTHMEWYRLPDGEAVFGEIAARPPGAHTVDLTNYASDVDMYVGWAEATCHGRFSQRPERRYNAVSIFKRAQGEGRIQRIEGLASLLAEIGPHIVHLDLLPVGAPRRDWRQTLVSDGAVILRHPDLERALEMADRVATRLQLYAG